MKFDLEFVKKVDHKKFKISGVYRIYSNNNDVNYVGISKNIFFRWKVHLRPKGRGLASKVKNLNCSTLNFEILVLIKNTELLKNLERYYIKKYDSFYNGQNADWGGTLNASSGELAKRRGISAYNKKAGVHGLSQEQKIKNSSKAGKRAKELGKGIHALSKEQLSKLGQKGGKTSKYIWEIVLNDISYKSKINEGLEGLCQRINHSYSKILKVFYRHKGFHEKSNCRVTRYIVENSVESVETK